MSAVYLFVYGSLRRNAAGALHPLLADAEHRGHAQVRGALYQVDWYPGLVLEGDGKVHGELYELPIVRANGMLTALDDYEGGGFRRQKAAVHAADGTAVDAWVYAYIGATHTLAVIPSGNFGPPTHRSHPNAPPPGTPAPDASA